MGFLNEKKKMSVRALKSFLRDETKFKKIKFVVESLVSNVLLYGEKVS